MFGSEPRRLAHEYEVLQAAVAPVVAANRAAPYDHAAERPDRKAGAVGTAALDGSCERDRFRLRRLGLMRLWLMRLRLIHTTFSTWAAMNRLDGLRSIRLRGERKSVEVGTAA